MITALGDLWSVKPPDWICITTNGFVKMNGEAVMGRGCARQAAQRYPRLPRHLGADIIALGNHLYSYPQWHLYTFPVKHNWWEKASLQLIAQSVEELREEVEATPGVRNIYIPRPGCGNGQLQWEDVRPLLAKLPDRYVVITNEA